MASSCKLPTRAGLKCITAHAAISPVPEPSKRTNWPRVQPAPCAHGHVHSNGKGLAGIRSGFLNGSHASVCRRRVAAASKSCSQASCGQQTAEHVRTGATSTSGSIHVAHSELPRQMVAAMAMSPLAALALPLAVNPAWKESARAFGERLRQWVQLQLGKEGVQKWIKRLDENLTFMDWSYDWLGIDLTYVWDPEMWLSFKEAVWNDEPHILWDKLMERIEYKSIIPQAGIVGDMRISYSKFMQLLESDRVKRIIVYGDMTTAIVEVPHPWYASIFGAPGAYPWLEDNFGRNVSLLVPNPEAPDDPLQWYCPEMPEWNMEKYRFYVDLPGDFWENGVLMRYLKSKDVQVQWDPETRQYVLPHKYFTKVFQVKTELQVLDPGASWDFLYWLTRQDKIEFYEKAAALCLFVRGVNIALNMATATPVYDKWTTRKKKKKSKEESMWDKLTRSTAREFMSKDAKTGKTRDTNVRFLDIAGLDHIVLEMREVVKMLTGDPLYRKVGAKVPRGIIFQGPPGTGKTYLARAIAGEAGVPFFSSVGSEFVEMFAGVAAARVNNLFITARRRAPAIIFIDEIDAIGRARSTLGSDPGSMERESALLAMLVQMDGIHGTAESVLTIGATNLAHELDQALLRPGRFEEVYEIPSPGPVARLEILRYHARNKKLESEGMLQKVAEVTQGWSAASLANLLNEAAILSVRRSVPRISLPMMLELVEGIDWGHRADKIPDSEAKHRLAIITAAKAVAFALTPGLEPIKSVTLWSRKRGLGPQVEFLQSENNTDPGWHPEQLDIMDYATNIKVNAATIGSDRLGEFLHCALMLLPMYAPRAAEVALWGREAASLATAAPLSDAFEIAYYCVRESSVHPRFKSLPPLMTNIWLGEDDAGRQQQDPLAVGYEEELGYHKLTLTLLKAAWRRSQRLVAERTSVILQVAEEMLNAEDEAISGARIVELLESTPLDDASELVVDSDFMPILKEVLGKVPHVVIEGSQAADDDAVAAAEAAEGRRQQQQQGDGAAGAAGGVSGAGSDELTGPRSCMGCCASATFRGPGQVTFVRPPPPVIKLSRESVVAVAKAIMGRLDVVDLIGRNTAVEIAERVRDALLDPETANRLEAVRRYAASQNGTAPFPPAPLTKDIPTPLYGMIAGDLEFWQQRLINNNVVSFSALEMLMNERQIRHYGQDADVPRWEDTSEYKQQQARQQQQPAAAAAAATATPAADVTERV